MKKVIISLIMAFGIISSTGSDIISVVANCLVIGITSLVTVVSATIEANEGRCLLARLEDDLRDIGQKVKDTSSLKTCSGQ